MTIRAAKGIGKNWFTITRKDGSTSSWNWPPEGGLLPHDLCHYVMEKNFGLTRGTWGLRSKGMNWNEYHGPGMLQRADEFVRQHVGGDATELIQAEVLANSLRQQIMVGKLDTDSVIALIRMSLEGTKYPVPSNLDEATTQKAILEYEQLKKLWDGLEEREYLDLEWKD